VGVPHDVALLDVTVLLEETGDLLLSETRMYACDEKIRAWVAGRVIILSARL